MGLLSKIKSLFNNSPEEKKQEVSKPEKKQQEVSKINYAALRENDLLLWFKNGPLQNYNSILDKETDNSFIKIIDRFSETEPSLIDVTLPIAKEPADPTINLGYWPRYEGLKPDQRCTYINWLKTGAQDEIAIGYVFIYYYGLERFLFTNEWEKAFIEIIRIVSRYEKIGEYCMTVLTFITIINKRNDLLDLLINKNLCSYPVIAYVEFTEEKALNAETVFNCIPFTDLLKNKLYYKQNYELFHDTFIEYVQEIYDSQKIKIKKYDEKSFVGRFLFINNSIGNNVSLKEIPNIFADEEIKLFLSSLLIETHDRVKEKLKIERKNNPIKKEKKLIQEISEKPSIIIDYKIDFKSMLNKAIKKKESFEYKNDRSNIAKSAYNSSFVQETCDIISDEELKNTVYETTMNKDSYYRDTGDVLHTAATRLIDMNKIQESFDCINAITKLPESEAKFISLHFACNNFVSKNYKYIKEDKETKEMIINICLLDFEYIAIYNNHWVVSTCTLPCVGKLIQILINDDQLSIAMEGINYIKEINAYKAYNDLLPKLSKVEKKLQEIK